MFSLQESKNPYILATGVMGSGQKQGSYVVFISILAVFGELDSIDVNFSKYILSRNDTIKVLFLDA